MKFADILPGPLFAIVLVSAFFFAPKVLALDGYQDRNNVYASLSVGGGYGFVNRNGELLGEGPGMVFQGSLGGGVSDRLTLGVESDWWVRSVDMGGANRYTFHHASAGGVGKFFVVGGLFFKGGAGFAYGICSGIRADDNCRWQELGLATEGGVGYEFWFSGNVAGGIDLSYTHHFYSHSAFDTASLAFGIRWY